MASLRFREKDSISEIGWVEGWEEKSGKISMLKGGEKKILIIHKII